MHLLLTKNKTIEIYLPSLHGSGASTANPSTIPKLPQTVDRESAAEGHLVRLKEASALYPRCTDQVRLPPAHFAVGSSSIRKVNHSVSASVSIKMY